MPKPTSWKFTARLVLAISLISGAFPCKSRAENAAPEKTDLNGDPLPPGALARMGEVRFRHVNVQSLAFSPDGKFLASGGEGIRQWEMATGKPVRTFGEKEGWIHSVAYSPDGKIIASGSEGGAVQLWDAATGVELRTLRRDEDGPKSVCAVAFAPDGRTVAAGGYNRTIWLWDTDTGKNSYSLTGHKEEVTSLAFSPDGKTLASAGNDKGGYRTELRLWDPATGKAIRTLSGHHGDVCTVAFSPDGKVLASGGFDARIHLWDAATGRPIRDFIAHRDWVNALAFSPDGKAIASAGHDGAIRLWQTETGTKLVETTGHEERACAVAFSPDGKTIVSGGYDGIIRLWETATGKERRPLRGHQSRVAKVTFSPDGKTLATASDDRTVRLWEVATGKEIRVLPGHEDWVRLVAFLPDGKGLVSRSVQRGSSDERPLWLWDAATGKKIRSFTGMPQGHIFVAPDGKMSLAHSDLDRTIRLWDVATGKEVLVFRGHQHFIRSFTFSQDGKLLASSAAEGESSPSGGRDTYIRLWDVATGKQIRMLTGYKGAELGFRDRVTVQLSPDGKTLASGASDCAIRLWDTESGAVLHTLRGHADEIETMTFSPDGKTLASSAKNDNTLRLWETATGKEIRVFTGHQGLINSIAFSPDGKSLASASFDTTALVWSVAAPGATRSGPLTDQQVLAIWTELAGGNVPEARRAMDSLVSAPQQALPFLEEHLQPVRPASPRRLAALLSELDSDSFNVREKARRELEGLEEVAAPALRLALADKPPLELGRRIEALLDMLNRPDRSPDRLRALRAVQVLEQIGTPDARRLLDTLAQGAPEARLTQDAKAALGRLNKREGQ